MDMSHPGFEKVESVRKVCQVALMKDLHYIATLRAIKTVTNTNYIERGFSAKKYITKICRDNQIHYASLDPILAV